MTATRVGGILGQEEDLRVPSCCCLWRIDWGVYIPIPHSRLSWDLVGGCSHPGLCVPGLERWVDRDHPREPPPGCR